MSSLTWLAVTAVVWAAVGIVGARVFGEKRVNKWTTFSDGITSGDGSAVVFVIAWPLLLLGALMRFVRAGLGWAATGKWRWY